MPVHWLVAGIRLLSAKTRSSRTITGDPTKFIPETMALRQSYAKIFAQLHHFSH